MRTLLFLSVLILAAACRTSRNAKSDNEVVSILHGTSYGHCRGYCIKETLYTADRLVYTEYSRDSASFPKKAFEHTYTAKELNELFASIDEKKWKSLPDRIGCPDCADGGAEYIEIRTTNGVKRVTFEAHSEQEGLEKALELLRAKRKTLEKSAESEDE